MRQKLFGFNNKAVKSIFYFLFSLTFYFALTSPNLILGDNHITRIGTTFFTTKVLLVMLAVGLAIYASENVKEFLAWLFIDKRWITASCCLALAFIIQFAFVFLIHPGIGFDVGGIHYGVLNPKDINTIGYFSVNPNNLNMLLMEHWLSVFFKQTSWLFFDILTTIFVDISVALNLLSISVIDKTKIPVGMYIHALWLSLFPMIIIPYTDTWVLPFISLYILCYCLVFYSKQPLLAKALWSVLMGFSLTGAYFAKPSGIIPANAIIIIELIHLLKKRTHSWTFLLLITVLFAGATGSSYFAIHNAVQHEKYIRVNSFRAKPMIHFINMGLSGDGGYNAKDSYKMAVTIDKQKRIDYSVNSIKKRLGKMGFFGYMEFLVRKQNNNTSDGTFAWVKEGDFIHGSPSPAKKGIRGKIENFIYLYGNNLGDFRYIAQIWWCIWLGIIFFAWKDNRKITQIMRLAIIGGFLFLLIFEGGRSRYLIQFLPAFLLLAALSFDTAIDQLSTLFGWVNADNKKVRFAHKK